MGLNLFGRFRAPKKIPLHDLARAFWQDPLKEKTTDKALDENISDPEKTRENPVIQHFWVQYVRPL